MRVWFFPPSRYSALFAVLAFALPAAAGTGPRVVYRAAEGCPSEDEFAAKVTARGGNLSSTDGGRIMNVTIQRGDDGYSGSLQIAKGDATSNPRDVRAAECAEVADALAVVTALALRAADAKTPAPAVEPPPAPPAPKTEQSSRLRASGDVGRQAVDVPAGKVRFDPAGTLTISGGAQLGMLPSTPLPRYDISFSRANFVTTPDGKQYLFGPVLRLRASFFGPASYQSGDTSTAMNGFSAGVGPCYSPIYDTRGLILLLCADFSAGEIWTKTKNGAGVETQAKTQGLGIAGLGAETQYNLGQYFQIGLKVGADFPMTRLSAERPDGSEIFRSGVTGYATLGLGVHF